MYTQSEREVLCNNILDYICEEKGIEGLLLIGSGACGYRDIYSDIDLMAGCADTQAVISVNEKLCKFFENMGCVYIDRRKWSDTVLGLSAYFENGLSADISFMPTKEIRLKNREFKVLLSKSELFSEHIADSAKRIIDTPKAYGIDDTIHHRFFYALRRCEIAVMRGEYIYADMVLGEARQYLLYIEAALEGKRLHQFKRFQSLEAVFLTMLEKTYPACRDSKNIVYCKEKMVEIYLEIVGKCDFLHFDTKQLKLINCFGESQEK